MRAYVSSLIPFLSGRDFYALLFALDVSPLSSPSRPTIVPSARRKAASLRPRTRGGQFRRRTKIEEVVLVDSRVTATRTATTFHLFNTALHPELLKRHERRLQQTIPGLKIEIWRRALRASAGIMSGGKMLDDFYEVDPQRWGVDWDIYVPSTAYNNRFGEREWSPIENLLWQLSTLACRRCAPYLKPDPPDADTEASAWCRRHETELQEHDEGLMCHYSTCSGRDYDDVVCERLSIDRITSYHFEIPGRAKPLFIQITHVCIDPRKLERRTQNYIAVPPSRSLSLASILQRSSFIPSGGLIVILDALEPEMSYEDTEEGNLNWARKQLMVMIDRCFDFRILKNAYDGLHVWVGYPEDIVDEVADCRRYVFGCLEHLVARTRKYYEKGFRIRIDRDNTPFPTRIAIVLNRIESSDRLQTYFNPYMRNGLDAYGLPYQPFVIPDYVVVNEKFHDHDDWTRPMFEPPVRFVLPEDPMSHPFGYTLAPKIEFRSRVIRSALAPPLCCWMLPSAQVRCAQPLALDSIILINEKLISAAERRTRMGCKGWCRLQASYITLSTLLFNFIEQFK